MSSDALASATETDSRYVKEWTLAMASIRVLTYADGCFSICDEIKAHTTKTKLLFATLFAPPIMARARLAAAYKTGAGVPWGEHDPRLFPCVREFFKPLYEGLLVKLESRRQLQCPRETTPETPLVCFSRSGTGAARVDQGQARREGSHAR